MTEQLKPPCDCIEKIDGFWEQRCDCRNSNDLAGSARWCAIANSIPPTHRVVSVELLEGVWNYISSEWGDDGHFAKEFRTIINNKS